MSKELLEGSSSQLVSDTERELGITIIPKLDPNLPVGSQSLLQEMKTTGELVVLLKPDRQDHQYLIAQACLSAMASNEAPFHLKSAGSGEAELAEVLKNRGVNQPEALANHLVSGTGSQLRGSPLLALSAMRVFNDYPELRPDQLKYFKLDCAQGAHALTQAPVEFAGPILDAHLALNGAVASVADFLFEGNDFFKPFSNHPIGNVSTYLVEDLYGVSPKTDEFEILDSWIAKLSLRNYFQVTREQQ